MFRMKPDGKSAVSERRRRCGCRMTGRSCAAGRKNVTRGTQEGFLLFSIISFLYFKKLAQSVKKFF